MSWIIYKYGHDFIFIIMDGAWKFIYPVATRKHIEPKKKKLFKFGCLGSFEKNKIRVVRIDFYLISIVNL